MVRNVGYAYGSDASAEQTYQLATDELPSVTAENGLDFFCEPVILYHSIQERAKYSPSFLRRSLRYMIHAKQRKRTEITISLSGNTNAELRAQNIFPLYALFARSISDILVKGHSPLYRFNKACLLTSFNESGSSKHTEATFIIPDLTTLATIGACNFEIILVSCGHIGQSCDEINCSEDYLENSSVQKLKGKCFWGKIPVSFLHSSLNNCVDLILGRPHEFSSTVVMSPGFVEPNILDQDCQLLFCSQKFNDMCSYQLKVSIFAEEAGAKYIFNSPYSFCLYRSVPSSSSLDFVRLRVGNVLFNYMYVNNICQTEVTEDFTCPFCLIKCGNFKGLECHLLSSHDLFNFEFKISEKQQAVNISLKHHNRKDEIFLEAIDPRHETFSYFSQYKKYGRLLAETQIIGPSKGTEMIAPSETTEVVKSGQLVSMETKSLEHAHAGFVETQITGPSKGIEMIAPSETTEVVKSGQSVSMETKSLEHAQAGFVETKIIGPSKGTEMIAPSEITEVVKSGQLVSMETKSLEHAQAESEITEVVNSGQLVSMETKSLEHAQAGFVDGHVQKDNGISVADVPVAPDCSLHRGSVSRKKVKQFRKTRKLRVDRSDTGNQELLQKHQFFHSHKGQKMSFEEVLSDHDSEGEIDNDIVDLEVRAVLDTYYDITKDEKHMMHLWNSFVRRQRVVADGHIPRACKAFSELHGLLFAQNPSLRWCWRLFMIKLWNHNLLDGRTMDTCNRIIDDILSKPVNEK